MNISGTFHEYNSWIIQGKIMNYSWSSRMGSILCNHADFLNFFNDLSWFNSCDKDFILKKSSLQEIDDCIFFRWNFTVRTTFCYIQWYNVFTNGALLIIRLLHFSQINHFGNLFYLPQLLVMHVLLYLVID